jgi:hypothetical protein
MAFTIKACSGAVVGVLLAAPLMIAGLDYLSQADLGLHASTLLGSGHFPPQALPQLLLPYIYGPIFDFAGSQGQLAALWSVVGGYISTSLLMLGALGVCSRGHRGLRTVLAIWLVLVFARMYGQIPLLGHVLGWLPGMQHIAFFRYATPALELPLVILAALGIHDLLTVPEHRRRALWAALGMLAIVAIETLGARSHADDLDLSPRRSGALLQRQRLPHALVQRQQGHGQLPATGAADPPRDIPAWVVGRCRWGRQPGPPARRCLPSGRRARRNPHGQLRLLASLDRVGLACVRRRAAGSGPQCARAGPPAPQHQASPPSP